MTELNELVTGWSDLRIVVVGDLILDRYIWGEVTRISPEAPIPVLRVTNEEWKPGGAGAVAMNLLALGMRTRFLAIVGEDAAADTVSDLLVTLGLDNADLVRDPSRETTVKSRLIARTQHLLRVDRESRAPHSEEALSALAARLEEAAADADMVLVSDYDKGLFWTGPVLAALRGIRERGVQVLADPAAITDYSRYRGLSGLTPNRRETELATGLSITDVTIAHELADTLRRQLGLDHCVVTLDRDGMVRASAEGSRHLPTVPRAVFDVTGAGDMVLSILGVALAAGNHLDDAIRLANIAGGIEVGRIGVSPITREELLDEISRLGARGHAKVLDQKRLLREVGEYRRRGQRLVFTNGCYDVLHVGHLKLLEFSRGLGDILIVGLNTDRSVRALKGPKRPIITEQERARVLSALSVVDHVVLFDEETPLELIAAIRPDVLVKGEDYRDKVVVGRELVESYGGQVALAPIEPGFSTTGIVDRIREAEETD